MILTTLLSMGGGFLVRLLPEYLAYRGKLADNKHELALQRMSLEAAKLKLDNGERVRNIDADLADAKSGRAYALAMRKLAAKGEPKTGLPLVDGFNGAIRSIVTLWVLCLYSYTKAVKIDYIGDTATCDAPVFVVLDLMQEIWGPEDTAMLGAIIGYHFGAQAIKFLRRHAAG